MQLPHFEAAGLNLSGIHTGTVNVDLAPVVFEPVTPALTVVGVRWTDAIPPETFSFFRCKLTTRSDAHLGWIYRPHPETKVEHEQPPSVVEILAPWMEGAEVGSRVAVSWSSVEARAI